MSHALRDLSEVNNLINDLLNSIIIYQSSIAKLPFDMFGVSNSRGLLVDELLTVDHEVLELPGLEVLRVENLETALLAFEDNTRCRCSTKDLHQVPRTCGPSIRADGRCPRYSRVGPDRRPGNQTSPSSCRCLGSESQGLCRCSACRKDCRRFGQGRWCGCVVEWRTSRR